jgi:hypothetical protein
MTTTIQKTSKNLKGYLIISTAALFFSIFILFCNMILGNSASIGIFLIIGSIINIFIAKILIWWHHE